VLRNYVKIAFRTLLRYKGYSFINIAGLAVGMAACLMMLFYLRHELTYDAFHANARRIYRVVEQMQRSDGFQRRRATTGTPLAPLVLNNIPDVDGATRISQWEGIVRSGDSWFREPQFTFADPTIFDVFTFPLKTGDPSRVLSGPNKVVLTEECARKYFGKSDPVGRTLTFDNTMEFTVTGVLQPIPSNSHLQFGFLASFETLEHTYRGWSEHWDAPVATYLLFNGTADPAQVGRQLGDIAARYRPEDEQTTVHYALQPLADIHLSWDTSGLTVLLFPAIALFILILAVINYINLSTARAFRRAREVGIRKVVGAQRRQLAVQFIGDSLLTAFIALPAAIVLAELSLPAFNALAGTRLAIDYFGSPYILPGLLAVTLLVGVLSGCYPAFVLSSFRPIKVIRGVTSSGRGGLRLRSGLVVFQFTIAIALIVGSIVTRRQSMFLQTSDMGFDREEVLVVRMDDPAIKRSYESLKHEMTGQSGVLAVTAASDMPGGVDCRGLTYQVAGSDELFNIPTAWVDYDYLKTMGIPLAEGRAFSHKVAADAGNAFVLNQSAVTFLGMGEGVGSHLSAFPGPSPQGNPWHEGQVIGVTEDFHFRYLYCRLQPLVIIVNPQRCDYMLVRISPKNVSTTLASLKQTWQNILPGSPFEFSFLDDEINRLYRSEEHFAAVIRYAGLLAILVACLGVLGLASFMTETRVKEIGIRKVHGASVWRIIGMLSSRYAVYVAVAGLVAGPIAYYALSRWLEHFIYRITIGVWPFILAIGLSVIIALLSVAVQTTRAALANPVTVLRHE
jgi:putative ABC transport system permease protein